MWLVCTSLTSRAESSIPCSFLTMVVFSHAEHTTAGSWVLVQGTSSRRRTRCTTLLYAVTSPYHENSGSPFRRESGRGLLGSRWTPEGAWRGQSHTYSFGVWETLASWDLVPTLMKSSNPRWLTLLGGSPSRSAAVGNILSRCLPGTDHPSHIHCVYTPLSACYRIRILYLHSVQ